MILLHSGVCLIFQAISFKPGFSRGWCGANLSRTPIAWRKIYANYSGFPSTLLRWLSHFCTRY